MIWSAAGGASLDGTRRFFFWNPSDSDWSSCFVQTSGQVGSTAEITLVAWVSRRIVYTQGMPEAEGESISGKRGKRTDGALVATLNTGLAKR